MERDYGVFYFLEHAGKSPVLNNSAYFHLLNSLRHKDEFLRTYPGSPLTAAALLGTGCESYLFCDLDGASLDNIRKSALPSNTTDLHIEYIKNDGVLALQQKALQLSQDDISKTFVHIDPYDPLEKSKTGINSIDLFCDMTQRGAKTMLWYGFDSQIVRKFICEAIETSPKNPKHDKISNCLWCGEINLSALETLDRINPGIKGCGILCGNLRKQTTDACSKLGKELAKIYEHARFPDGTSGALDFSVVPL